MSKDESQPRQQFEDEYKEFERRMLLFEEGPTTTNFQQLLDQGVELPEPATMLDADVNSKLWQVIHALASMRVYLDQTDHLSDRQLYSKLWHQVLRAEVPAIDLIGFNTHVTLLSSGDEEETRLYLQYYADEDERQQWLVEFPNYELPAHENPPNDRDQHLPQPYHDRSIKPKPPARP